jgi:hypothetical protein
MQDTGCGMQELEGWQRENRLRTASASRASSLAASRAASRSTLRGSTLRGGTLRGTVKGLCGANCEPRSA